MIHEDSIIVDLVKRVTALTHRNWLQQDEPIDTLRDPGFEDFLIKANQGIALASSNGYFFYVSKSLAVILGHPINTLYEKGPDFFQQVIRADDKLLVREMISKSEQALQRLPATPTHVRVSFDYHLVSGKGDLKRIYQHTLPGVIVHDKKYYTLFILMDLTGFKSSPQLNYRVSYLSQDENFETIHEGKVNHPAPYVFTKREIEILNHIANGRHMEELADKLFISIETLKKHRQNILLKTGAKNMVSLIDEGLRNGWINVEVIQS